MIILSLAAPFFERTTHGVLHTDCGQRVAKMVRYYRDDDFQELLGTDLDCPCGMRLSTDSLGARVSSIVLASAPEKIFIDAPAITPLG